LRFIAVGVRGFSVSVDPAGGGKSIVLTNVDTWEGADVTGRGRKGTGRLRKGRRLIARQKTAVVTAGAKRMEKRWMTLLQESCLCVL